MTAHPPTQQGFAALAAIVLVVVMAALAAFMLVFSNAMQLNAASDVQGSRAYWVARAGIGWAAAQLKAAPGQCPQGAPHTVDGFSLVVDCRAYRYTDGARVVQVFDLTATARWGNRVGGQYVERSISAALEQ